MHTSVRKTASLIHATIRKTGSLIHATVHKTGSLMHTLVRENLGESQAHLFADIVTYGSSCVNNFVDLSSRLSIHCMSCSCVKVAEVN